MDKYQLFVLYSVCVLLLGCVVGWFIKSLDVYIVNSADELEDDEEEDEEDD